MYRRDDGLDREPPSEAQHYIDEEDGDNRAIIIGLRKLAKSIGAMSLLAERTGLSRETLYRTL